MKATIELDDALYRQVKAAAALQGRKVKDLVADALRRLLEQPSAESVVPTPTVGTPPPWVGSLRAYAHNGADQHDLSSMRQSIARGRARAQE